PGAVEGLVDITHGARTALPQHAQNLELRVRRSTLPHSDLIKFEVVRKVRSCSYLHRAGCGGFRSAEGNGCRGSATDLGSLTQVLFSVHLDELEEVRERQRPDQQSQNPEVWHARERTDQRDERVNVRPAAEHHRSQ